MSLPVSSSSKISPSLTWSQSGFLLKGLLDFWKTHKKRGTCTRHRKCVLDSDTFHCPLISKHPIIKPIKFIRNLKSYCPSEWVTSCSERSRGQEGEGMPQEGELLSPLQSLKKGRLQSKHQETQALAWDLSRTHCPASSSETEALLHLSNLSFIHKTV